MHIVIVGGGEIGFALAQALLADHQVVVIDNSVDVGGRFEPLDVQFVLGPGTSADVLSRAGVEKTDVLVACTGLDEVNIVACGIARHLGSPRTFCFVSAEEFLTCSHRSPNPSGRRAGDRRTRSGRTGPQEHAPFTTMRVSASNVRSTWTSIAYYANN
jgi:hypothetical protein